MCIVGYLNEQGTVQYREGRAMIGPPHQIKADMRFGNAMVPIEFCIAGVLVVLSITRAFMPEL